MTAPPVLAVENLEVRYPLPRRRLFGPRDAFVAATGVDLALARGQVLGLVGESGSGKSSTARAVMALERPTAGTVKILGSDIFALPRDELQALRPEFQMIFQDPYGSLNPRHAIGRIVAEPLRGPARRDAAEAVALSLEAVGLRRSDARKYPHQFSGGQRQRIAIARALVTRPSLIVADEPVSALDVSVQAQVLNLMKDLQAMHRTAYLFISHDLGVVRYMCTDLAVMFRGRIVETGDTGEVLREPAHPYTRELLDAMPRLGVRRRSRVPVPSPEPPASGSLEAGCPYLSRCKHAVRRCASEAPRLRRLGQGRRAACHLA